MPGRKPKVNRSTPTNVGDGPAPFRMELGERIRWLLDQFTTRSEAARIAGVTPEHLASYIAGRAKPPFELIARLAAAKKVSLDWLATGEGAPSTEDAEPEGFVSIALQPDAEARFDAADEGFVFSRAWLNSVTRAAEDKLRIVIQRGNANDPVIKDGDMLLVDTTIGSIADNAVDILYVFAREGRYVARFVETLVNGRVALKSRNPQYAEQTLSPEEAGQLQIFGRVCWRGGVL